MPSVAQRWVCITLGLVCVATGIVTSLSTNFHVFGTDKVGQDVLYQVLKSLRTALVIGLVLALSPLLGAWGAMAAVMAGLLVLAALAAVSALARLKRLSALLSGKDDPA